MATVLSAYDLKMGKTADLRTSTTLLQPIQMLPRAKKTEEWRKHNMDWFEQLGLRQLGLQNKRLTKLFRLAEGQIDRSDYILDKEENENYEILNNLLTSKESPFEIKFYPIVPQVINVMCGEFSKRSNKLVVYSVDEFSVNEMLESKRQAIEDVLITKAKNKIAQKLADQGIPLESEEAQQAFNEIQSLPEIEDFYKKSYRSIGEQWASRQMEYDSERFSMYEKENDNFRNYLTVGRQFWHVRLKETDYDTEIWHPNTVFFHKTSSIKYVSEGDYAGRILMMSISDALGRYGYLMTADQSKSMESMYSAYNNGLLADGHDFTEYYDPSRKPDDQGPNSIHYERLSAFRGAWLDGHFNQNFYDPFGNVTNGGSAYAYNQTMVRVTELYWKSQRLLGHLYKIDLEGNLTQEIVTEDYKITEKGIYDQSLLNVKTKDTLVFGEHIDWFYAPEVWKGIKISPNFATHWTDSVDSFIPLYLDVKPLKFQFKGINDLYGCRLPVEGLVDPSSIALNMYPFQVQYNVVNNQIADILIDELGTVILMDQNVLPSQSMGEEWGQNRFQKAYQVMKDFSILPVDTSLTNTEQALNFQHFQKIELQQDKRLMSRIELANYFKEQCFEAVGITRQRAGQVAASESATGVQQAVNNSYSQTEKYFTSHSNFLMPRVREMMLNAAQFFNSTKPSIQLSYLNSDQEKTMFAIEGYKLLLKDFGIINSSRPDHKVVVEQLKQMAMANTQAKNASIYDLAKFISSDTVSDIVQASEQATKRLQDQIQAQQQHEQEIMQQQIKAQQEEKDKERAFEAQENALDRQAEIYKAQVQALGFAEDKDADANGIPDVLEAAKFNADLANQTQQAIIANKIADNNYQTAIAQNSLKEKEIAAKRYVADRDLQIALANKTEAEIKAQQSKSKKPKK